jgi:protease-4
VTDPASKIHSPAHEALAADRYRRSRGFWRWLAFLAAAIAIFALVGRFVLPGEAGGERIARVTISGTISTDAQRVALLDELAEDDGVKAVIVAINSPGGTTAGGEELYEDLRRLSEAKPTVAVIRELGASAAYMTALGTDQIFARRLSIVGSIGVLFQHVNAGKLLDTIGIDLDKVASGPLKAEPDINEPISPEVRASIAALVGDSFDWFVDIVAERRNMDEARARSLADGRIVTGRVGVETGLIDAIGGEREALVWLESEHGIDKDLNIVQAWPLPRGNYGWVADFVSGSARSILGLEGQGPVMLDGLISLWQVEPIP